MVREPFDFRFLPAAGASAVVGLVVATRPLGVVPRAIALACVVGAWAAPVAFRSKTIRAHATVVASIAAAIAAGQVDAGVPYGLACALLLLGCIASMRAARAAPAIGEQRLGRRPLRAFIVLVVTTTCVAAGLVAGLPRLAEQIERRINAMFGGDGVEATAFSTTMVLGSTRGMLQSDTIVMRIDGKRPDYLRGAVYDRYEPPFWVTTGPGRQRHVAPATARAGSDTTRITLVRGAPNGDDMRWFLPAGACDFGLPSGQIEIDAFGVARRARGEDPPVVTFHTEDCAASPAPIARPTEVDLDVPARVRRALAPIATGWTAAATTDREKLLAIQQELSRFEYSLAVPRHVGLDPVVDFVTVHRAGHCEMFASAMVLLARMEGIPARVVGGYRVSEVNPLTGRAVVRDRNAHAWVEAWIDGAWRGIDPTPVSESFAPHAGVFDHLGDALSTALERVVAALSRLGLLGTAGVLVGVIAVLLGIRWIDAKLDRRRGHRRSSRESWLPLPCFESLVHSLARTGHDRDESEPIEAFARRLETVDAPWALEVSEALLGYARLRYGDEGEEALVVRALERAARAVQRGDR
jgi:hypothetical protein